MNKAFKRYLLPLEGCVLLFAVALDQLTKHLARVYLVPVETVPLWKDVLHLTYVENTGASFGILKGHRWVFLVFSTLAIAGLLFYMVWKRDRTDLLCGLSLAMICGGGIGNMIDRIANGYVVDFVDFRLIHFAVFNVADSFVCVGVFLLAFDVLFLKDHE